MARDFKNKADKDREDLFAATPPLEAERMALSRAVTQRRCDTGATTHGVRKLMFIDARKAHLNPPCEEDVYIELPDEAGQCPGFCGKLVYWLYGCRLAAQAWEKLYADKLVEVGFIRGEACGMVFYHKEKDLSCAP